MRDEGLFLGEEKRGQLSSVVARRWEEEEDARYRSGGMRDKGFGSFWRRMKGGKRGNEGKGEETRVSY